jgi:hypothetical protein
MPRAKNPDFILSENKFFGPFVPELARGNGASCARASPINLFSLKMKTGILSEELSEIRPFLAGFQRNRVMNFPLEVELIINFKVH